MNHFLNDHTPPSFLVPKELHKLKFRKKTCLFNKNLSKNKTACQKNNLSLQSIIQMKEQNLPFLPMLQLQLIIFGINEYINLFQKKIGIRALQGKSKILITNQNNHFISEGHE